MSDPPPELGEAGKELCHKISAVFTFEDDPREEHALVMACQLADDVARLRLELADSPLVTMGSTGQPVESPLLGAIRNAIALQSRLFGTIDVTSSEQALSHSARALVRQRWAKHG